MSDQDVKPLSATGTFKALSVQPAATAGGKPAAETGKAVPAREPAAPDLEKFAARLNAASKTIGRELRFKVDMEDGSSVIQVIDRDTGEIIRQIPAEKAGAYLSGNGGNEFRLYDELV